MSSKRAWSKVFTVGAAAALVASACGSDSKSSSSSAAASTSAASSPAGSTAAPSGTSATSSTPGTAGAEPTAGDATDGQGAQALQDALKATESSPLAADSSMKPFVIAMPNLEGDPSGTFPDVREGAEAAVKLLNERLGGIGADVANRKAGRPVKLEYCGHKVDQNEAQSCANTLAAKNPQVVMPGIEFFTALMYPLFKSFPVVETLPISIADFDQPGVISPFGGCPTGPTSSAEMIGEIKKHDRAAIIWADGSGVECWKDTEERFYQTVADSNPGFEFKGFPYTPGDATGISAVSQQVADYVKDATNPAIYYAVQASDCAAFTKGLRSTGTTAQIYIAEGCNNDAVRNLPEAKGLIIELQGYVQNQPDLNDDLVNYEMTQRAAAYEAYGTKAPLSSYTNQAFAGVLWITQVANDVLAGGGNIDDADTLRAAFAKVVNYHILGYRPISCANNPPEYESVCARTATYAEWDGSAYTIDPAIPNGVIDVTDLMLAVQKAHPRTS